MPLFHRAFLALALALPLSAGEAGAVTATRVADLERAWPEPRAVGYFPAARALVGELTANAVPDPAFYAALHDLVASACARSDNGEGFDHNDAKAVRACQADIVAALARDRMAEHWTMPGWAEARARRGRLLMLMHARWWLRRDASLDGQALRLDSTVGTPEHARQELARRNRAIALQDDLRRFMEETAPLVEDALIRLYAQPPHAFVELNELLLLGGYGAVARARALRATAAAAKVELPEPLRQQVAPW